jgi:hypothetical protein
MRPSIITWKGQANENESERKIMWRMMCTIEVAGYPATSIVIFL